MHALVPPLAALGRVVEDHHAVRLDRDVLLAHRGEPVGLVLDRVLLGADAEEAALEQPHGAAPARTRAVERVAVAEVGARRARAAAAARCAKRDHVVELLGVAPRRARRRGSGTACGRRRRCPSPAGARAGTGRSRRPPRPAGSPARRSAPAPPARRPGRRRRRSRRSRGRGAGGGSRGRSSRRGAGAGHGRVLPGRAALGFTRRGPPLARDLAGRPRRGHRARRRARPRRRRRCSSSELARVGEAAPAALVLDLRGLDFMDSSGLRVIAVAAPARAGARPPVCARARARHK